MKLFECVFAYVWGKAFRDTSNSYLIVAEDIILVDPGRYKSFANLYGLMRNDGFRTDRVDIVLNTHLHLDHCESNRLFCRHGALQSFYRWKRLPDVELSEVADRNGFEVIHTPGHSPDSVTIYLPESEAVISGDLIFENGIPGRTDLPESDARTMISSLELVQSYEPKYVLPGHGRIVEGREGIAALFDKAIAILDRY